MAVVKPKRQPISLPTNTAVIDASESKDDADPLKDLKFEWSLERVPIQYNKSNLDQSSKEATLKLKNLIAGTLLQFKGVALHLENIKPILILKALC